MEDAATEISDVLILIVERLVGDGYLVGYQGNGIVAKLVSGICRRNGCFAADNETTRKVDGR